MLLAASPTMPLGRRPRRSELGELRNGGYPAGQIGDGRVAGIDLLRAFQIAACSDDVVGGKVEQTEVSKGGKQVMRPLRARGIAIHAELRRRYPPVAPGRTLPEQAPASHCQWR